MERRTSTLLGKTTATSAAVAAVLSPVPLSDEIVLGAMYLELARRIGRRHGLGLLRVPWRPIGGTIVKGLFARGFVNFGLSFVPGVDVVVNAITAAGLTEVLGHHIDASCEHPERAKALAFRDLVEAVSIVRKVDAGTGAKRRRFEIHGLFGQPRKAGSIEQRLLAIEGVTVVRANARSGRVLVKARVRLDDLKVEIERALRDLSDEKESPPPSVRRLAAGIAESTKKWSHAAMSLVRRASDPANVATAEEVDRPWHAMSVDEVVGELSTSTSTGLATKTAEHRLRERGPNLLPGMRQRTGLDIVGGEIFTVPTAMLAGAIVLSVLSGDVLEGAAIALVLGSNVVVGYFTESRAEELLGAWGRLRAERALVVRNGREISIRASDLVVGDLLLLRSGQAVAADARVIEAEDLFLDESTLTGESEPVEKNPNPVAGDASVADRSSLVHTGTMVASGRGKAVVCATGYATTLGALQRALSRTEQRTAPLERQLAELGRTLALVSLGSSIVVTVLGALRGQAARVLVRNAIALGVAAIPEGFPTVGTTALALASQRLQKNGIIIRRLAAAETLGAVGVICADKTGTLTENRMRIAEVLLPTLDLAILDWQDGHFSMRTEHGGPPAEEAVHNLARIAALNADVEISAGGEIANASGTERALVEFAIASGYPVRARRKSAKRVGEKRRSPDSPMMLTIHEHPDLGRIELAKGAPEEIVPRCGGLDPKQVETIMESNAKMAGRGLRVLGFAWRRDATGPLEFAGLVGLRDPPRPKVREAIEALASANIHTLMLTGDQARTAVAIGEALGISKDAVHSRVTPEAKLDIVQDLQRGGAIVAMTGDGVNDGPALKAADVGIAMGERGTDLARAVADVVLAHDDLPSLVEAVAEGRTLYDNVRRAIDYLVATNLSEVALMLVGSVIGIVPLSPLHLLWINILTDVAPALALAMEPREGDVMRRPPRDPRRPLFGSSDSWRLGTRSAQMTGAALASYAVGSLGRGANAEYASTMAFASLVTSQLLETANYRARPRASGGRVRWVLGASLLVQGTSLMSSNVRSVLGNARLKWGDLVLAVATGVGAARFRGREFRWLPPRDEIVVSRTNAANRAPLVPPQPSVT